MPSITLFKLPILLLTLLLLLSNPSHQTPSPSPSPTPPPQNYPHVLATLHAQLLSLKKTRHQFLNDLARGGSHVAEHGLEGKMTRVEREISRVTFEISQRQGVDHFSMFKGSRKQDGGLIRKTGGRGRLVGLREVKRKLRDVLKLKGLKSSDKNKVIARLLELSDLAEKRKTQLESILQEIQALKTQKDLRRSAKSELARWTAWAESELQMLT